MSTDNQPKGKGWKAAGLTHLSPSQLTRSVANWIFQYVHLSVEQRRAIVVGENAALGTAVHDGVQRILCDGADVQDCHRSAQFAFDLHEADEDSVKRKRFREDIPQMIDNAVSILGDAGFDGAIAECKIETFLDGVDIPVMGYVDLLVPDTMFCEIKTKAARKTRVLKSGEQGWSKATLPKTIERNHLLQVAIYHHALKITPAVCYVAEHDAVLFTPFNCDDLKSESLREALEDARQRALIRQNLINYSSEAKDLAAITDPDWSHQYQWKIDNKLLSEAKKLWQL